MESIKCEICNQRRMASHACGFSAIACDLWVTTIRTANDHPWQTRANETWFVRHKNNTGF